MKYKRQFMGSMFALALLVSNYPALDVEDLVPASKVSQYVNQVKMKSDNSENKIETKKQNQINSTQKNT